jgi:parvulin-like peptidyl-prolyl isomerase
MLTKGKITLKALIIIVGVALIATGCGSSGSETATPHDLPTAEVNPTESPTPSASATPTPLPVPAAALVNGEVIPLSYFEHEVQRYKAAFAEGEALPSDAEIHAHVLGTLIEQQLLSQAARAAGFTFTDQMLEEKIADLLAQLGSGSALTSWMQANFYDDAEFRMALRLGSEAAWQRDQIAASVPDAVEQVRARQIFTKTAEEAQYALASLNSGVSFDELAWRYSPETGGELGWFPHGYLLFPAIEEAAFRLPVGLHSEIIQTEIGYHIIEVMEHADAYPLTTDAKLSLQAKTLAEWLQAERAKAQIEITMP